MFPATIMIGTYAVLAPIAALIVFPYSLITRDPRLVYWVGIRICALGVWLAGVRVTVEGLGGVPQGEHCIFMSNHVSNMDPGVFIPNIPGRVAIMIKRELLKLPVIGQAFRFGQFIPVARSGDRQSAVESIRQAAKTLAAGAQIAVFPEGTRSPDGRLRPLKKGPFFLARETGAPIIPVSISGTERMMQKGSLRLKPGRAIVRFHPPVFAKNYNRLEDLIAKVHDDIASGLPEHMQPSETASGVAFTSK